ncbi:hypothetical protein WS80_24275 [Burkholderia pseudomultivorans]|nr:hypothetical protein WS80_24275 [Burkholderia pseudomultivorans]
MIARRLFLSESILKPTTGFDSVTKFERRLLCQRAIETFPLLKPGRYQRILHGQFRICFQYRAM